MHMRYPNKRVDVVEVEATYQKYKQAESFVYFGDTINSICGVTPEFNSRIDHAWKCFAKCNRAVYGNSCIALPEMVCFLKAEVIKAMLYGWVALTLSPDTKFGTLREAHRGSC